MRAWDETNGQSSQSGWSDVVGLASRAAAVLQLAALPGRAALHAAAPFGAPAPFHQHVGPTLPPFGNAPIQSAAAIRSHAALQAVTELRPIVHGTNLRRPCDSCQTID